MLKFIFMKAKAIKLELLRLRLIKKLLNTTELPVLEQIENLLYRNQPKETPVSIDDSVVEELGYWLNGEPVSEKSLSKRLEKAEQEKMEGKLVSNDAFKKEAENW